MRVFSYFLAFTALASLYGCWAPNPEPSVFQSAYTAVLMDREEFENSVAIFPPREVINAGKIYIKGEFLFVNDVNQGFHVFSYSDPQTPVPLAFIQLFGATDLAIRADMLYINQAVDLVTLSYNSAANTITVTQRNEDVFPQKTAPDFSTADNPDNKIIIDWTLNE